MAGRPRASWKTAGVKRKHQLLPQAGDERRNHPRSASTTGALRSIAPSLGENEHLAFLPKGRAARRAEATFPGVARVRSMAQIPVAFFQWCYPAVSRDSLIVFFAFLRCATVVVGTTRKHRYLQCAARRHQTDDLLLVAEAKKRPWHEAI